MNLNSLNYSPHEVAVDDNAGDTQPALALQRYLVAHYAALQRRLTYRLGSPELASESLHDAWLRLGELTICATVVSLEAYVYRIACNVATDRVRNNRPWQYHSGSDSELAFIADAAPGPEHIAAAGSDLKAVQRAMQCLPYRHQAILRCLRLEDLTSQEVAARYHISQRRVEQILRQALNHCALDRPA